MAGNHSSRKSAEKPDGSGQVRVAFQRGPKGIGNAENWPMREGRQRKPSSWFQLAQSHASLAWTHGKEEIAHLSQAIFSLGPASSPPFRQRGFSDFAPGRWELLLSRVTNFTRDRDDRSTAFLSPTGLQLLPLGRAVSSVPCCLPASRGPRRVRSSLTYRSGQHSC